MARSRRTKSSCDSSTDVPAWMTTFSDCMTLLLTFFVLLLSFSSFDVVKYSKLKGAFECPPQLTRSTVFRNPVTPEDSLVEHERRIVDRTKEGSEKPDEFSTREIENPKSHTDVMQIDAYADRRTFYLPAAEVFLGNGCILNRRGREMFDRIGRFMKMVPCNLVACHVSAGASGDAESLNKDIGRAQAIVGHIVNSTALGPGRFRVMSHAGRIPQRYRGADVVKINLVNRDVTRN